MIILAAVSHTPSSLTSLLWSGSPVTPPESANPPPESIATDGTAAPLLALSCQWPSVPCCSCQLARSHWRSRGHAAKISCCRQRSQPASRSAGLSQASVSPHSHGLSQKSRWESWAKRQTLLSSEVLLPRRLSTDHDCTLRAPLSFRIHSSSRW